MEVDDDVINLHDLLEVIAKRWKLIVVPALVITFIAGCVLLSFPRVYESYTLLTVGHIGASQIEGVQATAEIMRTLPVRIMIAEKMKMNTRKYVKSLRNIIGYENTSGLLKIAAIGESPAQAQQLVSIASDIVVKRHEDIYNSNQKDMDRTLSYIKSIYNPVPLSYGLAEVSMTKTRIEIPAILPDESVSRQILMKVSALFAGVLLAGILIAFFVEGRGK